MIPTKMAIVDIETTGLDPVKNGILSIGAVALDTGTMFYVECFAQPGEEISNEALLINGFGMDEILVHPNPKKMEIKEALVAFGDWALANKVEILGGHNVSFDIGFLRAKMAKYGAKWRFGHRYVDIHSIAYGVFVAKGLTLPEKGLDLKAVLQFTNLEEANKKEVHSALYDAQAEAEAFSRLTIGKNLDPLFASYPIPEVLVTA